MVDSFRANYTSLTSIWSKRGAIGSGSQEGQSYVQSIERMLLHGLRLNMKCKGVKLSLVYVISLVDAGLQEMLRKLPQKLSVYAVERAWIRHRLNTRMIGDCVSKMATAVPKTLYQDWALMRSSDESRLVVSLLREASQSLTFAMDLEDPPGFAVQTTLTLDRRGRTPGSPMARQLQSHSQSSQVRQRGSRDLENGRRGKGQVTSPVSFTRKVVASGSMQCGDGSGWRRDSKMRREASLPQLLKTSSHVVGKNDVPAPESLPFDTATAAAAATGTAVTEPRGRMDYSLRASESCTLGTTGTGTGTAQRKFNWGSPVIHQSKSSNPFDDTNDSGNGGGDEGDFIYKPRSSTPLVGSNGSTGSGYSEGGRGSRSGTTSVQPSHSTNPFDDNGDDDDDDEDNFIYKPQSTNPFESESGEPLNDVKTEFGSVQLSRSTNPFDDGYNGTDEYSSCSGSYYDSRKSSRLGDEDVHPSKSTNPFEDDEDDDNNSSAIGTPLQVTKSRSTNPFDDDDEFKGNPFSVDAPVSVNPFVEAAQPKAQPKRQLSRNNSGYYSPGGLGSSSFTKSSSTNPFDDLEEDTIKKTERKLARGQSQGSFERGRSDQYSGSASSFSSYKHSDKHESEHCQQQQQQKSPAMPDSFNPFCDDDNSIDTNEPPSQSKESGGYNFERPYEEPTKISSSAATNSFAFDCHNKYSSRAKYNENEADKHSRGSEEASATGTFAATNSFAFDDDDSNNDAHKKIGKKDEIYNFETHVEEASTNPFAFDDDDEKHAETQTSKANDDDDVRQLETTGIMPTANNERDEKREEGNEEEEDIDSSLIFKMYIKDSIIIDGYDKRDTTRTLYEIAKDRTIRMHKKEATQSQSQSQPPTKDTNHNASGSSEEEEQHQHQQQQQEETDTTVLWPEKAPKGWVPSLVQANYYLCEKGVPGPSCFGCGAAFGGLFSAAPRYCEFTGKFFCSKCHSNRKSVIPARVVRLWDRGQYPVNNKSHKFIEENSRLPMMDLMAINPALYGRVAMLKDVRLVRKKLYYMKDFISSCAALGIKSQARAYLNTLPDYYYNSMDIYSLYDFVQLDAVLDRLVDVLEVWLGHIDACFICKNKGSYCEICGSNKLIYPFQLIDVVQCPRCFGVFHKACYTPENCPKCKRKETRDLLNNK